MNSHYVVEENRDPAAVTGGSYSIDALLEVRTEGSGCPFSF